MTLQAREHFLEYDERPQSKSEKLNLPNQTFEYRGLPYTYMCSEFSTKAKLTDYLAPVFTKDAIKKDLKIQHYVL